MVSRVRRRWLRAIMVFAGITGLACVDANRSNPLDGGLGNLFVARVKNPSGGEQLFPGTVYQIGWTPALQTADKEIAIQLVRDADTTMVADRAANSGVYYWRVPNTPSEACRIRIIGAGGAGESPAVFRIKPLPALKQIDIGGMSGWGPAALRDRVVFETRRDGNYDLWMVDRDTGALTRMTSNPHPDVEATWFKPGGKVFAYTAYDDPGGTLKNVRIRVTEGALAGNYAVTEDGGFQPSWQNTDALEYLALAYIKSTPTPTFPNFRQIYAITLNSRAAALPVVAAPIAFFAPAASLTPPEAVAQHTILSAAWTYVDQRNELLYVAGEFDHRVFRRHFPLQDYNNVTPGPFALSPELAPDKISISPSGAYIAFGARGDIWVASINGLGVTPVTFGEDEDAAPDWATDTELVFQRRHNFIGWQLWSVKLTEPP